MQSLNEDIRNEGNRKPITLELPKLDEQRVLLYLATLEGNLPNYQLGVFNNIKNACSV